MSSLLKQENTAINSYTSSGSKYINAKDRRHALQCPSPIKVSDSGDMTPVN